MIEREDICVTWVPSPQGFQNGVYHFCSLKIDQVTHETGAMSKPFSWASFGFSGIGNCNIDFFNFCYRKVGNFENSNLIKNQNFAIIFRKYQNRNRKSTKYFESLQKPEILWNVISFMKSR